MTDPQAAALARRIFDSFPIGEPPPRDQIALETAPRRVAAALAGWTWDRLPEDRIASIRGDLAFLRPAAFVYYLPALLHYLLPDPNRGDVLIDDLLAHLAPPDAAAVERNAAVLDRLGPDAAEVARGLRDPAASRAMQAAFEERERQLTDTQIATIGAWLEYLQSTWAHSLHPEPVARVRNWVRGRLS